MTSNLGIKGDIFSWYVMNWDVHAIQVVRNAYRDSSSDDDVHEKLITKRIKLAKMLNHHIHLDSSDLALSPAQLFWLSG